MKIEEAAEVLGISREDVEQLLKKGDLSEERTFFGGRRVEDGSVEAYIEAQMLLRSFDFLRLMKRVKQVKRSK